MAICELCNKDMRTADGCLPSKLKIHGKIYPKVPWDPVDWGGAPNERCYDCNVAPGKYHHPGCDVEVCPCCGRQAISCDEHMASALDVILK